jgi:hypothetical protein
MQTSESQRTAVRVSHRLALSLNANRPPAPAPAGAKPQAGKTQRRGRKSLPGRCGGGGRRKGNGGSGHGGSAAVEERAGISGPRRVRWRSGGGRGRIRRIYSGRRAARSGRPPPPPSLLSSHTHVQGCELGKAPHCLRNRPAELVDVQVPVSCRRAKRTRTHTSVGRSATPQHASHSHPPAPARPCAYNWVMCVLSPVQATRGAPPGSLAVHPHGSSRLPLQPAHWLPLVAS